MTAIKTIEIPAYKADEPTPAPGYYLAWMRGAGYPITLHNRAGQTEWRRGAQLVGIDYYAGPLPERGKEKRNG